MKDMSKKNNDIWIESAIENFIEALGDGEWSMARAIIEDTRDKGFEDEADHMENRLASKRREATGGFGSFKSFSTGILDTLRTPEQKIASDKVKDTLFINLRKSRGKIGGLSLTELATVIHEGLGEDTEKLKNLL